MEIVREYKRPNTRRVVLEIPENFVHTNLEILIIPVEETAEKNSRFVEREKLFDEMCGIWEGREDVSLETIRNKAWKRN